MIAAPKKTETKVEDVVAVKVEEPKKPAAKVKAAFAPKV